MALGPGPLDLVPGGKLVQLIPQVLVDHRLLGGGLPSVLFPAVNPGGDAVLDVLGVSDDLDLAGLAEGAEAFDGGAQFHAVVGGGGLGSGELAGVAVEAENAGPAARAGVAYAGAVSDQLDSFHRSSVPYGDLLYHRIVTEPLEPEVPQPPEAANEVEAAGESPLVLIPVMADDVARQKRRRVLRWLVAVLTVLAIAGWMYKKSTDPLRAQESCDAAQRLFAVARYNQAIVACDRAVALKPDFADAYMLRGRSYVAQYESERGIPDFTKTMELRPLDPQGPIERAHAYINQKDYAAAIADLDSALVLDSKLARAYNLRGTALRALGQPQKAIAEFDRAAEIEPNSDNYFQRGATYQILGDHQRAIQDFTLAISWDPDKPQTYFARAESERAVGAT